MKRKRADRHPWQRVLERRYAVERLDTPDFQGYVSTLWIDAVWQPLFVPCLGQMICIADAGHVWLQLFPDGTQHTLTAMLDADRTLVQWYVDICQAHGMGDDGVPWYDDLYLDVIALPSGEVEIIDVEELDEALANKLVTPDQFTLAWHEAIRVRSAFESGTFRLLAVAQKYLKDKNPD